MKEEDAFGGRRGQVATQTQEITHSIEYGKEGGTAKTQGTCTWLQEERPASLPPWLVAQTELGKLLACAANKARKHPLCLSVARAG